MRRWGEFKISLRDPRDRKILLRSPAEYERNGEYALGVGCKGMQNVMIYNFGLEQAMRNLTSDDQDILLAVI